MSSWVFKRVASRKISYMTSSVIFIIFCKIAMISHGSVVSVDHLGDGRYLWIDTKTYHSTLDEAVSACSVFQESYGYGPCEPYAVNFGNYLYAGYFLDESSDPKTFNNHWFYFNVNCPASVTFSEEQGCINNDNSCSALNPNVVLNPIVIGIGNKKQHETDYRGLGTYPLSVNRTYNSVGNYDDTRWRFLPEVRVASSHLGVVVVRASGQQLPYDLSIEGDWISAPDVAGTLASLDDGSGNVVGWRYISLAQVEEDYDVNGRLLKTSDRRGDSHTYTYNNNDITVTHSNGDVLVYHYDSGSKLIVGFTTPDNQTYSYAYSSGSSGQKLMSLTYPGTGGTRIFHYENTNFPLALTGISDANGERFATWAYDSEGRVISSEHSGGAEGGRIDYTHIDDSIDPRATLTNALGKQTTYHFANIFGARKVTQVEGHPSANCAAANKNYSYHANGFIASKTDWKGNTTTYVRNTKGQELSRTEASGTPDARTITTEWHSTFNLRTKVTEPDRETIYSYDANGNLLSQQTNDLTTP